MVARRDSTGWVVEMKVCVGGIASYLTSGVPGIYI
jgi:hypothetical protein